MKRLRSYSYEFEWKHGDTASMITYMGVRTPRSKKFVSAMSGPGVVVYGILSDEPFVAPGRFPLQHFDAIVAEIKRERERLLQAKADAERTLKVKVVKVSDILNNPTTSFKAEAYIEQKEMD